MQYCKNWYELTERYKKFWSREQVDRPILKITAPKENKTESIEYRKIKNMQISFEERWTEPEIVMAFILNSIENTYFGAEAFPCPYIGIGPCSIAAFLGAEPNFTENTVWHTPNIQNMGSFEVKYDDKNKWYKKVIALISTACEMAVDSFFVPIPDLGSHGDILGAMRGADKLLLDVADDPENVTRVENDIMNAWYSYYNDFYSLVGKYLDGSSCWMGIWSPGKSYAIHNDFSCMISPGMFKELFLKNIIKQSEWLDNSIYHVDGEGALIHLDTILSIKSLDAIQWVPGSGKPTCAGYIPLLKKIQQAGKGLFIYVAPEELEYTMNELSPRGLIIRVDCKSEDQAKALENMANSWKPKH